jgi:mRNA interferase MazF
MKRGDVYLADLDPTKGSEQAGRRPVLIFEDDRLIPATLSPLLSFHSPLT